MIEPKYVAPKIPRENTLEMLGTVRKMLRELGHDKNELDEITKRVFASGSYDEACDVLGEYFPVEKP